MTTIKLSSEQLAAMQADPHYQQFVGAAVRALTAMLTGEPQPAELPGQAHLSPEARGALERQGMNVADAAIHRAKQEIGR